MRTEATIFNLVLNYARQNEHIKIVTLEGSRTNINIVNDEFQDYDITFIVDEMASFTSNDLWLSTFGNLIMLQKPEDMELFPPEILGFSYLMFFDDYTKIDLTLVPLNSLDEYLKSDKLIKVLLDKSNLIKTELIPTDIDYHLKKPTARMYDDCCNEFWNLTLYVVKGLCRKEILFAIDHLNVLRNELLRMISWKIGTQYGFKFSIGKNYKFIDKYISAKLWKSVLKTYCMDSYDSVWQALFLCHKLFREVAYKVADFLNYKYPSKYDDNINKYVVEMYSKYR